MEALKESVEALRRAEAQVAAATRQRDDAVRRTIKAGVPVATIAYELGVSKARVYQIRDHRR